MTAKIVQGVEHFKHYEGIRFDISPKRRSLWKSDGFDGSPKPIDLMVGRAALKWGYLLNHATGTKRKGFLASAAGSIGRPWDRPGGDRLLLHKLSSAGGCEPRSSAISCVAFVPASDPSGGGHSRGLASYPRNVSVPRARARHWSMRRANRSPASCSRLSSAAR